MHLKAALHIAAIVAIEFALATAAMQLGATLCRADASAPSTTTAAPPIKAASPLAGATEGEAPNGPNLLVNGDFASGSGKSPDSWRTGGWYEAPTVTSYDWVHAPGGEAELVVNNRQANDARWLQTMTLQPGWYYVGAEVRTEEVPNGAAGASVSLDEDSMNSADLHGSAGWQRLGLYLKVGAHGADVDVALRLGGFGSLNTGRAFFRKARVVKLDALPANAAPTFDLSVVRRSLVAPPVGKPWTLVVVFVLLAGMAVIGSRIYGVEALAPAPVKTPPPRSMPRSERRRRQPPRRR